MRRAARASAGMARGSELALKSQPSTSGNRGATSASGSLSASTPSTARTRPSRRNALQILGQGLRRLPIVGHVQNPGHGVRDHLEPTGEASAAETGAERGGRDRQPLGKRLERRNGGGGVADLDASTQRRGGQGEPALGSGPDPAAGLRVGLRPDLAPHLERHGAERFGRRPQRLRGIRLADDGGPTRSEDAGLLAGDGVQGIPQPIRVVVADRGHHRDIRVDQIHRIQPAAQAHLQDHQVRPGAHEEIQGRQGAELEIGERDLAARPIHPGEGLAQGRVGGGLAPIRTRSL